jgi:hypothetical protein
MQAIGIGRRNGVLVRFIVSIVVVGVVVAVASFARPASAAAVSARCNGTVASTLQSQEQKYEAHPPGPKELDERRGELSQLITDASQEQEILTAVCGADQKDLDQLTAQLSATRALAYVMLAGVTSRELAQCPGVKTVAAGFVAKAWSELGTATPKDAPAPQPVISAAAKVQAAAAADGLTLPAPSAATQYWVTTIQNQGDEALKSCGTE